MSDDLDDFFSRLDGIAQIPEGYKYNVKTRTSSEGNSWWTAGERWAYEESRDTLLDEFRELKTLIDSKYHDIYYSRKEEFDAKYNGILEGINNLLITYKDDDSMIGNLNFYWKFFKWEIRPEITNSQSISEMFDWNFDSKFSPPKYFLDEEKSNESRELEKILDSNEPENKNLSTKSNESNDSFESIENLVQKINDLGENTSQSVNRSSQNTVNKQNETLESLSIPEKLKRLEDLRRQSIKLKKKDKKSHKNRKSSRSRSSETPEKTSVD